jgi:DNA-binding YbaB/EbfC family protein
MNIQQMMKQAQQMQKKMQENQANLEKQEFEGLASNGLVKVVIMGTGLVKKISIDDSLVDKEDKDLLEDLIIVAFNDARQKLDKAGEDSMSSATGGINLKNMKLPF